MARPQAIGARSWLEPAARLGFVTKGVIYLLIGALAVTAAIGSGGKIGGAQTALRTIGEQPFGRALLVVTAIGLFGYALWRAACALFDLELDAQASAPSSLERDGVEEKALRMLVRPAYAVSAVVHAAIGVLALQLALGVQGGSERSYVATVLSWDGGAIVLAAVAAALLGYSAYVLHQSWTLDFVSRLRVEQMSPPMRLWAVRIGRAGLAARAVVFILVGVGIGRAALTGDAGRVRGVGSALAQIASQPFGMFLLSFVAIGLAAYGLHQLVEARYRRIP